MGWVCCFSALALRGSEVSPLPVVTWADSARLEELPARPRALVLSSAFRRSVLLRAGWRDPRCGATGAAAAEAAPRSGGSAAPAVKASAAHARSMPLGFIDVRKHRGAAEGHVRDLNRAGLGLRDVEAAAVRPPVSHIGTENAAT